MSARKKHLVIIPNEAREWSRTSILMKLAPLKTRCGRSARFMDDALITKDDPDKVLLVSCRLCRRGLLE